MAALQILPAGERELPVVVDLILALAEYEKLSGIATVTEEQLRPALFGPRPCAEVVLARWEDEWAGLAVYFPTYSTFRAQSGLYLEDLFVRPHLRGLGIGRALLRSVARVAVERGCGRLDWSVLDWNEAAIEFYERHGAERVVGWSRFRLTGAALTEFAGSNV